MTVMQLVGDAEYVLDPLTQSLGFLTRVIQVQINERIRAGGGFQISLAAFTILQLVEANPGIRQVHASRILLIQESNMANLIKDLIAQELVERREEGKRIGLWLTPGGQGQLDRCAWACGLDQNYANSLSDKEYRSLLQLLTRVYRSALA